MQARPVRPGHTSPELSSSSALLNFPYFLRCLTLRCDSATINAMTSRSTENVGELLKFPLWRKSCKLGRKVRSSNGGRPAGARGAGKEKPNTYQRVGFVGCPRGTRN